MRSQARALGLDSTGTLHSPWEAAVLHDARPRTARRLIRAPLLPSETHVRLMGPSEPLVRSFGETVPVPWVLRQARVRGQGGITHGFP
jgi:hypothetical protein